MKYTFALLIALSSSLAFAEKHYTLDFKIDGVRGQGGKLYVQLFDSEANFKSGKPLRKLRQAANPDENHVIFDNLPEGDYLVRFFHDEDGDGRIKTNWFGKPTEGYGFSNNFKPHFGRIKFQKAAFHISGESDVITNHSSVIY